MTLEELRAENERLTASNARLANHIARMGDNLETRRRELLAIGWDAAVTEADRQWSVRPAHVAQLKAANPYRQPIPDFGDAA